QESRVRRRGGRRERGLAGGRSRGRGDADLASRPRRPRCRGRRGLVPPALRRVRARGSHAARRAAVRARRGTRSARRAPPHAPRLPVSPRLTALGVIPARLQSTRLPRKVLRELAGKPLIVHVYEAARRAPDLGNLLVATDSQEVVDACAKYGIPTMMTSAEHPSGTDRIWEVAQSRAADVYVNVQGDEPLLTPEHIRLL